MNSAPMAIATSIQRCSAAGTTAAEQAGCGLVQQPVLILVPSEAITWQGRPGQGPM
jgi:hypothetical protein